MDVTHEISTTTRVVGTRELAAGQARIVTLYRAYPTDVADLWEACTDPDRLARWFAPVTGDLRLGGRYQVEGNAGGTVTACEPPHRFEATWEMGEGASTIEVRITPDGDGARFTLTHVADVEEEFWLRYGPGATGVGWDLGLLGLAMHLAEPAAPRQDHDAFSFSSPGQQFIVEVGRDWERASVAGGLDADVARGMADRTIAFYTGPATPAGS